MDFKRIPLYTKYSATPDGQIYSHISGAFLSQRANKAGYLQVQVRKDGDDRTRSARVHRLVAAAFHGLDLEDWTVLVDHIDGDRANNKAENLRLVNNADNVRLGFIRRSRDVPEQPGVKQLPNGRWKAELTFEGRRMPLGVYTTKALAELARQRGIENFWKL